MKILFHIPSLHTIYAGRTIYFGYKHAFEDLGHIFRPLTMEDDPEKVFSMFKPNILFVSLNPYNIKYLSPDIVRKYKKKGVKVLVNLPFWKSPMSKFRINETGNLSENIELIQLIKSGTFGDLYYNVCEQNDFRMDGFMKSTGYAYHTIPLAADRTILFPEYSERFRSDISYIGTNLSEKRKFIANYVYPLKKDYYLKLYGQDWTIPDRILGIIQRGGQYFNLPILKSIQKPKLKLDDERKIYSSSTISINIHEEYQRRFGNDCNERTFKIPLCDGFEITDNVECIRKYFNDGKEIIIAENKDDWFDKIRYYMKNPEKRLPIIKAGKKRVFKDHTYHNRVNKFLSLLKTI